jgi:hypothetical protein
LFKLFCFALHVQTSFHVRSFYFIVKAGCFSFCLKYKSPFCCCKWPTVFACAIPFVATAVCFFVGCFWRRHSPPSDLTLCVFPSSSMLFVDPPCLSPLLSGRSLSVPSESFYFLALLLLSTNVKGGRAFSSYSKNYFGSFYGSISD